MRIAGASEFSQTVLGMDAPLELQRESRSAYITRVLTAAVRAGRDAEITRRLDEFFADERLRKAQCRRAAILDDAGTDWTDERW